MEERCDGYATCPPDWFADYGTVCGESIGECDEVDICTGTSAECLDQLKSPGEVCRYPEGECDAVDYCTGASKSCENQFQYGNECRPQYGECDQPEYCDGGGPSCPPDFFTSGNLCRASEGQCDEAEFCDGWGPKCPPNSFASGDVCRPPDGPCDIPEYCEGESPDCPSDRFMSGNPCRESDGICDQTEFCDGTSAECPSNGFRSGEECRGADGPCDEAEHCSGSSADCPPNAFASGNLCRSVMGECDEPEYCDGTSADCPRNSFASGEVCRPQAGECDVAEYCEGESPECPPDGYADGGVCRPSEGECDIEEYCNGWSARCPHDEFADGTVCRSARGDCDVSESCDGTQPLCPPDNLVPADTLCRQSAGICDVEERCTGTYTDCPDDDYARASVMCRASVGDCDVDDYCTGSDALCPEDTFVPAETLCGDQVALGDCDDPDRCDGLGTCLPNLKPSTTLCREDAGECDVPDYCTGSDPACPEDAFELAGTPCGNDLENACTESDTCDGYGWCDPNNVPCGIATNSLLCAFDESDCGGAEDQVFRLIYTPDVKSWPAYKLNASNPGQFGYNLIVSGTPGEDKTITIEVPYPFVTQGATPVRIYDADLLGFTAAGCFVPPSLLLATADPRIVMDDWVLGSGGPNDGYYNLNCQSTTGPVESNPAICTFDIDVMMPPGGQVYVHAHFDYGLKGKDIDANPPDLLADRYDAGLLDGGGRDALQNNVTNDGVVRVNNCEEYAFEHTAGAETFSDVVRSTNDFKRIAGVLGLAMRSTTGEGVANVRVRLVRSSGQEVVSGFTDRDGFYMLQYKHTGKPAMFTVMIGELEEMLQQPIELKANGWAEVSFDFSTGTTFGEFGTGAETPGNGKKK